ncbi:hypothetical protein MNBD_GAMMA12-3097 [hydrothermal vent metagenome]|uniref:Type IV conjugative transfer system protein TraL n=1 Tax=hydrothermal vent metagenome TaxID=652676 RepID=A0A3B0YU81_9ZZZZ
MMEDEQLRYQIPQHIDDPAMFYFLEVDEFIVMLLPIGMGIFLSFLVTGILFGIVAVIVLRKAKAKAGRGFVRHAAFWYLPSSFIYKLRTLPPSYIREWR